jgi:hypothetical protein
MDGKSVLPKPYDATQRAENYLALMKTLRCGLNNMPLDYDEFASECTLYSADLLTMFPGRVGRNGSIDISVRLAAACKKPVAIHVFSEYRTYFTVDTDMTVADHFLDPEPYELSE